MEKQLMDLIEKLSTQLGQTAEATWSILLAQAKIAAVTNFVAGGILILIAICSVVIGCIVENGMDKDSEDKGLGWFIGGLCGLVIALLSLFFILPAFTATYNSQFWALQKLIDMI